MGTVIDLDSRRPRPVSRRPARPLAHLDDMTIRSAFEALQDTNGTEDDRKVRAALERELAIRELDDH